MHHVQDHIGLLLECADLVVELRDPDGVECRYGHGCDGNAYGNKLFWPSGR